MIIHQEDFPFQFTQANLSRKCSSGAARMKQPFRWVHRVWLEIARQPSWLDAP
jgi:hypothetical protein